MTFIRFLLVLAALEGALAGCVANTAVESRQVTGASAPTDSRRRAEVHTGLAAEYYQRGNLTVALAATRDAIAADPTYANAHNMQGLVYMQLREDPAAREAFERALRLDPANAEVLNNYGWFLCLRNENQRGMEFIMRAVQDQRYATPEKALLSAGLCMRRQNKNQEAEEYLRRAVLIRPDLLGALFTLAALTYERGAYKDAEVYITRYSRMGPSTVDSLALGVKIARANRDKMSEDSFLQQLRRLYPEDPQTRELLKGASR
jgi:type IV pilus assembly protein PilF